MFIRRLADRFSNIVRRMAKHAGRFSIFLLICAATGAYLAYAASNIDTLNANEKWGWNNIIGWIDMKTGTGVTVGSTVSGYASSSIGPIMFDCATMPTSPSCTDPDFTDPDFKVLKNSDGLLSGWAWNDAVGWISMSGTTAAPSPLPYQVKLENHQSTSTGALDGSYFRGFAWNDVAGWISFNCLDGDLGNSSCTGNAYKTQTGVTSTAPAAEFISNIFDLGTATAALNTITWKGSQPAGTSVDFWIATAAATSTLTGNMTTVFQNSLLLSVPASPGSPVKLSPTSTQAGVEVENRRYFRYKVRMTAVGTTGPRIDDIIVSWSP